MSEQFRYGPLVYVSVETINIDEENSEGNYYWPGLPPVAYDPIGIPVDENGQQCLPGECILHLNHVPEHTEWNDVLKTELPTVDVCREWFEDHFLEVSDWDLCRYILRWYWWNHQHDADWKSWKRGKTQEEMVREIWPDVPKS